MTPGPVAVRRSRREDWPPVVQLPPDLALTDAIRQALKLLAKP